MQKFPVKSALAAAAGVALTGFLIAAGPVSAVEVPTTTTSPATTTSPTKPPTKPTATTGKTTSTKTITSTPKTSARPVPKGGVETGGGGTAPDGPDA
ncbi:hypothetical protein [Amycolatopsis sp. Hca4]|uniref:hypothetical protein n=1 Tax=Amycolatopsis sp. Hca4 TaxID=2742131 RepID=UPI0015903991|nr:hypothetical protein [Amycolatopsis sp. Hca4]QKV80476.1 hypothetical protein HUT10_46890 [Amycolatopsis sp. Hca4]